MIASLNGKIIYKSPELKKDSYFIISCGGVGYKVYSPISNLKQLTEGEEAIVHTYLSVSERALDLFGFVNPADKTFFILLLDVPGIGPKKAIDVLNKTTLSDVSQAIADNDVSVLTKMSGLSEKIAEKIMLILKDKIDSVSSSASVGRSTIRSADAEVFDALIGFGYSAAEAKQVLGQIDQSTTDVGEKIREALKLLGRH